MITLLDGSIGQELVKRAGKKPTALWSTMVMLEQPELVEAVHDAYFAAGADVATTNTYPVLRDRLVPHGYEDRFAELHQSAIDAACRSRDKAGHGLVAGAFGPLVASYRPDLCPPPEEAAEAYDEIARIHAGKVDLFLIETMCSIDQTKGAVMGASGHDTPIWVALSVDDADGTRLRSGEPLAEALPALAALPIDALLLNCSVPEAMEEAFPMLTHPMRGIYANGFTRITEDFAVVGGTVDALSAREDLGPAAYTDFCRRWRDQGANILGGCCEIGPAHIAHLRDTLQAEGASLARGLSG